MTFFNRLFSVLSICCITVISFAQSGSFYQNNLTFLPDGSGVNYSSSISISGFPGSFIASPQDMAAICVTMEHSYLGDIEMWLQCPNLSQVNLINAFDGGNEELLGGFNGGGTFLGDPIDTGGTGPGIGWEYCFSDAFNTWGDLQTEHAALNYLTSGFSSGNSMNPNGIYLPETSFSNLVGCPMDGTWTLYIRDNLGADDGWVFGWGLDVSPTLLGHSGFVFKDFNENCTVDNFEGGVENLTAVINPGNYVVQTNAFGGWYIDSLPVGTYTITVDTTGLWSPTCSPTSTFTVTDPNIFVETTPIGMVNDIPCSAPNISVAMPVARPCMPSDVVINVQNDATGTGIINNASVEIELDTLLSLVSASHPYSFLGNNTYEIDLGDIFPGQSESVFLVTDVDCGAILGQTLCNEAYLTPVDPCVLDTIPADTTIYDPSLQLPKQCTLPWDNSSLYVNGWCQNDSIYFEVINIGPPIIGDMDCYSPVLIYIDTALAYTDSIQLAGGQSQIFVFPGTGQTWVMNVPQHPLHPGNSNPTAYVELCGNNANWTPNIPNSYPENDSDPVVDVHCLLVTGSYDPNDKQASPIGITDEHYISAGDQLEYFIRFQNTGTDTAFTVVVRDTLDPQLNIFTVNPGAASHPYSFALKQGNVLEWTFNNILLPDSTTNESGSHGFLTFRVDQIPNLSPGSVILNEADIYFDFNAPIITNETWHTIFEGTISIVNIEEINNAENGIIAYPNPTNSSVSITVEPELIGKDYIVFDQFGRKLSMGKIQSANTEIGLDTFENGLYLIQIDSSSEHVIRIIKE